MISISLKNHSFPGPAGRSHRSPDRPRSPGKRRPGNCFAAIPVRHPEGRYALKAVLPRQITETDGIALFNVDMRAPGTHALGSYLFFKLSQISPKPYTMHPSAKTTGRLKNQVLGSMKAKKLDKQIQTPKVLITNFILSSIIISYLYCFPVSIVIVRICSKVCSKFDIDTSICSY